MIFLLIILAVSGIAMMGIMSMGNIQRRSQSQSLVPTQIVTIRGNIMNILKNQTAWDKTANDPANTTLNCYRTNAPCVSAGNSPILDQPILEVLNPTDNNGHPSYYGNNSTWTSNRGYGVDGSACTTYPSVDCPITFQVRWSCTPLPSGTTTGCDNTTAYANLQITVEPQYNPVLNPSTGQKSPDAIVLNAPSYIAGPVSKSTIETFYNFP